MQARILIAAASCVATMSCGDDRMALEVQISGVPAGHHVRFGNMDVLPDVNGTVTLRSVLEGAPPVATFALVDEAQLVVDEMTVVAERCAAYCEDNDCSALGRLTLEQRHVTVTNGVFDLAAAFTCEGTDGSIGVEF